MKHKPHATSHPLALLTASCPLLSRRRLGLTGHSCASMTDNHYGADNGCAVFEPVPAVPDTEKSALLSCVPGSKGSKYGSSARGDPARPGHQSDDPDLETASIAAMTTPDEPPPPPRRSIDNGTDKDARSVSWSDLPQKKQLIVITLARLSEPLVQTSLQVHAFPLCRASSPCSQC